jgi:hypothetical protein
MEIKGETKVIFEVPADETKGGERDLRFAKDGLADKSASLVAGDDAS